MKTALICGVSGQDGAYLARFLLEKGYTVHGTSRDAQVSSFKNLDRLDIRDRLVLHSMALNDFRSVLQVIHRVKPDEIYNLAGQTSVGLSFEQPVETMESITLGTLNLLEAIRFINAPIKFYNAGSSECFGNTGDRTADETTAFSPRSPYAVAKAAAHWQVANYREAYNLFACSGILFNHESPLRPRRFVTQKVVTTAIEISKGRAERLYLGDISIRRDWGWAAEYVEAMYLMLQAPQPEDYVIATGETHCLEDFVAEVFAYVGLDWTAYIEIDKSLFRPSEIAVNRGSPQKAHEKLGWLAQRKMKDVVRGMVDAILCDTSLSA
ncbi:GDP-mannose 4,6-dehydratase [Thermoleptolyngbya sichuanensis A183]|uniref:GDP-mannose 4,6-dehydratase n=1 Tax=Thermoleptolyngbya sichuanensis A183 TaxID=2737172 RepID=A0A6M8BLT4_9CYAN|nr:MULTISPECIES: GDP-mannose 4,6-dehydratase [Thermoleptolyngbya]QKD83235.1 GDP-mannose 4,6-dehydratase [Thermoleptolyngbya sichuanensis A183]